MAGTNAPQADEIKSIVESGGGSWIPDEKQFLNFVRGVGKGSPSSSSSTVSKKSNKKTAVSSSLPVDGDGDEINKIIIISSDTAYLSSVSAAVLSAVENIRDTDALAGQGIYTIEILFLGVLRQKLTFDDNNRVKTSVSHSTDTVTEPTKIKNVASTKTKK